MSLQISTSANADSNYNYDIFLSHSGDQKLFVHSLYHELQLANYKVFFDQDTQVSLPKGSHLLTNIMGAIKHCTLAVVVISEGFITSLWPMMELQHLLATPSCVIYPVFYELQPGDLLKEKNLKKWQKCWKVLAKKNHNQGCPIDISTWPQLLQKLKLFAGTIIPNAASQQMLHEKITEIVLHLCHKLPPPLLYEDDLIKGKENTVQAIEDEFEHILRANTTNVDGVLLLGVAGIAGSGKTTLCKTMVNYYNQHHFPRNSVLVELPTEEVPKEQLVARLKIPLQTITMAHKSMIKRITDTKQASFLFKQVKKQYFIAIDNVCEWSKEYVEHIVKVLVNASYTSTHRSVMNPKVIVTSRSKALLEGMGVASVINVPKLNQEEALDILLSYGKCWELYKSNQVSYEMDIKSILDTFHMPNACHPLLLKTLGNIMSQVVRKDGSGWEHCISELKSICIGLTEHQSESRSIFQGAIEETLFNALKANYSHLGEDLKNTFIDVAILNPQCVSLQNFSMLKDHQDRGPFELKVSWVEYYGLWRVCRGINKQIDKIKIHDLYKALAKKEAKKCGRFLVFLDCETIIAPSSLSKVTRIVNYCGGLYHERKNINASKLKGLDFSELLLNKVEVLHLNAHDVMVLLDARRYNNTTTSNTSLFQYLAINVNDNVRRIIRKTYEWQNVVTLRSDLCLDSLSILNFECGDNISRIDALECALNLQSLTLRKCYALNSIKGVEKLKMLQVLELDGILYDEDCRDRKHNFSLSKAELSGCLELKKLIMRGFDQVKSLADLHCPHGLEWLELERNRNLVDVGDIGCFGENLVGIFIRDCESLKEFPCVAMPKLNTVEVGWCGGLEGTRGIICDQNFPALKHVWFSMSKYPLRIAKSGGLETLKADSFNLTESRLGPDIRFLDITVNREQLSNSKENISAISGLTNLERLSIEVLDTSQARECSNNPMHSRLAFLSELTVLTTLSLKGNFDFVRSLEELSCLTNLSDLTLVGCSSVEDLPAPPNLSCLILEDCTSLRRLTSHDWSPITDLSYLRVFCCPSFEWFQDSLKTLTKIECLHLDFESCYCCSLITAEDVTESTALDLNNLKYMISLTLEGRNYKRAFNSKHSLQLDFSKLLMFTDELIFSYCCIPSISCTKWPPKLKRLMFWRCNIGRSFGDFSCPTSLEELGITFCKYLEETPELSNLVNLRKINLSNCPSLERLPGYTPRTGLQLRFSNCPRLETTYPTLSRSFRYSRGFNNNFP